MQGDIMLPQPSKHRAAPKPKLNTNQTGPQADYSLELPIAQEPAAAPVHKRRRLGKLRRLWSHQTRSEKAAIVSAIILLAGAGSVGAYYFSRPQPEPPKVQAIVPKPKPKPKPPATAASPLTGVQVAPELAKRPVTGVMIENSVFARPQSGLQDAGVVVEAIAEGGITRFLALYQESRPGYVGPVRSVRPYFIDFAAPFQASIAHVGGSPEALARIRNGHYRDIDQFFNSGYYWRSANRAAPHNVYTDFNKLDALNRAKGYTSSLFTAWSRKPDKKLAVPTAKSIDIAISSRDYYSHYDYDPVKNNYRRSEAGSPHLELVNPSDRAGVQIKPKVIIALVMGYRIAADRQHSIYADTGSGEAIIFQDGGVTAGSWLKAAPDSQIEFKDAAGAPLPLNAGLTWLTLVAAPNKVVYKP